jgi:hypothetical protein
MKKRANVKQEDKVKEIKKKHITKLYGSLFFLISRKSRKIKTNLYENK